MKKLSVAWVVITALVSLSIVPLGTRGVAVSVPGLRASKGPSTDVILACSIAKDKGFCVETLSSNPESPGADLPKLASLALQLARSKAMEVSDSLDELLKDEAKLPHDVDKALNDCSDQFSEALAQLEDTTNGLTADHVPFNDMRSWLAASLNNAEICQRAMLELKPNHLRASATLPNDLFAKLCDTSLSVVTLMQIQALKTAQAVTLS